MRGLLPLALLPLVGCGELPSSVGGTVTVNGQALERGNVVFHPAAGGPLAYGEVRAGGAYTLRTATTQGLQPGDYLVTVTAHKEVPPPEKHMAPGFVLLTPARYADPQKSKLRVTVKPGGNTLNLELTSP